MTQDERGLYTIYDIWHKPFWQTTTFFWSVVAFSCLIVVTILFLLVKFIRAKRRVVELTPWERALQQLQRLQEKNVTTKEDGKKIYITLTFELKQYLYRRYGYDVRWKTDDEVLNYLERHEFNHELLSDMRDVMSGGVMVKFANMHAVNQQIERHLDLSIALIQKTIPQTTSSQSR